MVETWEVPTMGRGGGGPRRPTRRTPARRSALRPLECAPSAPDGAPPEALEEATMAPLIFENMVVPPSTLTSARGVAEETPEGVEATTATTASGEDRWRERGGLLSPNL